MIGGSYQALGLEEDGQGHRASQAQNLKLANESQKSYQRKAWSAKSMPKVQAPRCGQPKVRNKLEGPSVVSQKLEKSLKGQMR